VPKSGDWSQALRGRTLIVHERSIGGTRRRSAQHEAVPKAVVGGRRGRRAVRPVPILPRGRTEHETAAAYARTSVAMKTLLLIADDEIDDGEEEAPATQPMTQLWWEDDEEPVTSSEIIALFV
jgi:hypothetical protein